MQQAESKQPNTKRNTIVLQSIKPSASYRTVTASKLKLNFSTITYKTVQRRTLDREMQQSLEAICCLPCTLMEFESKYSGSVALRWLARLDVGICHQEKMREGGAEVSSVNVCTHG